VSHDSMGFGSLMWVIILLYPLTRLPDLSA
jgi:hypothetical protein